MPNYQGTPGLVQINGKKSEGKTSIYKGVHWHKRKKKWFAEIREGETRKHLGAFSKEEDAAKEYLIEASKYYGQPVRLEDQKKLGLVQD
jgi:hypothetical protein